MIKRSFGFKDPLHRHYADRNPDPRGVKFWRCRAKCVSFSDLIESHKDFCPFEPNDLWVACLHLVCYEFFLNKYPIFYSIVHEVKGEN